jgi:hypothetical protein
VGAERQLLLQACASRWIACSSEYERNVSLDAGMRATEHATHLSISLRWLLTIPSAAKPAVSCVHTSVILQPTAYRERVSVVLC